MKDHVTGESAVLCEIRTDSTDHQQADMFLHTQSTCRWWMHSRKTSQVPSHHAGQLIKGGWPHLILLEGEPGLLLVLDNKRLMVPGNHKKEIMA